MQTGNGRKAAKWLRNVHGPVLIDAPFSSCLLEAIFTAFSRPLASAKERGCITSIPSRPPAGDRAICGLYPGSNGNTSAALPRPIKRYAVNRSTIWRWAQSGLVETVIAAQGELERHQIRRQTLQKMKARVEQGFYVFRQPVGYRYMAMKGQGSLLFKDESVAPLVQEAMEGFASGRFQTQAEVKRFLEQHPEFPRDAKGEVRNQHVADILKRPVYAGMVEAPRWGVSLRKGHHEPLISFET